MAGALYGLNQIGKDHLVLKEKQYESLKNNIVKGTDTLAILPTGQSKSMIYQLLAPVFDFGPCLLKDTWELGFGRFPIKSSYARPDKLRAFGMRVCIWKDDKVSNCCGAPATQHTNLGIWIENKNVFQSCDS